MVFRVVKQTFDFSAQFRAFLRRRRASLLLSLLLPLLVPPCTVVSAAADRPFWQSAILTGESLACVDQARAVHTSVVACTDVCRPIPWQLDERDGGGRLCLDQGPEPNRDDPDGIVDRDDEILWMADDGGRRIRPQEIPADVVCAVEVAQRSGPAEEKWVYLFVWPSAAPRSAESYVHYDPRTDVVTGSRVGLGFGGPTPEYFALRPSANEPRVNLLDRLKVRASARFFGIIPLWRDEGDLRTEMVGWKAGPIRVVRRQRQWVVLGWGLRTPIFRTDTLFYRDYAYLPVHLRLNFPPTYFFRGIEVLGVLDFRDLGDWHLLAQGLPAALPIGTLDEEQRRDLNRRPGDWFALLGPSVTLVQMLTTSPSLATVERTLVLRRENGWQKPERWKGEMPGVGYRLTDWNGVDRGQHWFASTSYALPAGYDVHRFLAERHSEPVLVSRTLRARP
jgi:hypothetical protein